MASSSFSPSREQKRLRFTVRDPEQSQRRTMIVHRPSPDPGLLRRHAKGLATTRRRCGAALRGDRPSYELLSALPQRSPAPARFLLSQPPIAHLASSVPPWPYLDFAAWPAVRVASPHTVATSRRYRSSGQTGKQTSSARCARVVAMVTSTIRLRVEVRLLRSYSCKLFIRDRFGAIGSSIRSRRRDSQTRWLA